MVVDKPLRDLSRDDIIEFSRMREEPEWVLRRRLEAYEYLKSTPPDPAVDPLLEKVSYKVFIEGIEKPVLTVEEALKAAERLGVRREELEIMYTGFTVNIDNVVVKALLRYLRDKGVVLTSMDEAVKRYPIVKDYAFQALRPNLNRKVAYHVMLWAGGPFVYVPKGVKVRQPIQGVFVIGREGLGQTEHTLIILDEDSALYWVEGCTTPLAANYAVHLGGLEGFVASRARLHVVSINNWLGQVHHMPSKRVIVHGSEAYAELTAIAFWSKTAHTAPRIDLKGYASRGVVQNIALYQGDQKIYTAPIIVYEAPKTSAQILNRSVVKDMAVEEFRGTLRVKKGAKDATGFMSCNTLIIGDKAHSITVPALDSEERESELSHEASVGRISYEKLYYLQLMGFDENEATWLIVSGFFEPAIAKLPIDIQVEVRKIIELALLGH